MSEEHCVYLPTLVYQMCVNGALIAGSLAKKMCGEHDIVPGDYDLLVPLRHWQTVALLIPDDAKPNKFGGWRFMTPGTKEENKQPVEVDVWPSTVEDYLKKCKTRHGGCVCLVDFINNKVYMSKAVMV